MSPAPAHAASICLALAFVVGIGACGGTTSGTADDPPTFPAAALAVASSTSGQLHVELRTDPQPPVRGAVRGQLAIIDASGAAVDGLGVVVLPWMPAHGHGTTVAPQVSAHGGGQYLIDQLYLYMGGTWELRTTISGPVDDEAVPEIEVP
jgi:hypothetical protein